MLAAVAIVAGLLSGWLAGGAAVNLVQLRFRGEALLLVAFVAQGLLRGRIPGFNSTTAGLTGWVVASLVVVGLLVANFRVPGALIAALGTLLNVDAVLANGGMPVAPYPPMALSSRAVAQASSGFYMLSGPGTMWTWAGDVLPLRLLGARLMLSVGDMLLLVGVAVAIASAMILFRPFETRG